MGDGGLSQSRERKWGLVLPKCRPGGSGQGSSQFSKTCTLGDMEWWPWEEVSSSSLKVCKPWQNSHLEGRALERMCALERDQGSGEWGGVGLLGP